MSFISTAWSQSQDNKDILICGSDKSNFTISELEKCSEITLKDSDASITSFLLSMAVENKLIEMKNDGNSLDDATLIKLKELGHSKKVYLEKIEIDDGQVLCCRIITLSVE